MLFLVVVSSLPGAEEEFFSAVDETGEDIDLSNVGTWPLEEANEIASQWREKGYQVDVIPQSKRNAG